MRAPLIYFDATYAPKALAVLPDINGNGRVELVELGVASDGSVSARAKDSKSGKLVSKVDFGALQPMAFCAITAGGLEDLAFLGVRNDGVVMAKIFDAFTGAQVDYFPFSADRTPIAMIPFVDINGNGRQELAVLSNTPKTTVQLRDVVGGSLIGFSITNSAGFLSVPDMDSDGWPEIAAVGAGSTGATKVEIRNPATGQVLKQKAVTNIGVARSIAAQSDSTTVGVLVLDKTNGVQKLVSVDLTN